MRVFWISTALSCVLASPSVAVEIQGTVAELTCVYENREALSLFGFNDPARVYVPACRDQFAHADASDTTHGGVQEPELDERPGLPPIDEWSLFTIDEMERIGCKLDAWRAANLDATEETRLTLDLSDDC